MMIVEIKIFILYNVITNIGNYVNKSIIINKKINKIVIYNGGDGLWQIFRVQAGKLH